MTADQPTIDAIVDAVHRLAERRGDWESVESVSEELAKISPAAAARLNEPTFAAALVRGVQPAEPARSSRAPTPRRGAWPATGGAGAPHFVAREGISHQPRALRRTALARPARTGHHDVIAATACRRPSCC